MVHHLIHISHKINSDILCRESLESLPTVLKVCVWKLRSSPAWVPSCWPSARRLLVREVRKCVQIKEGKEGNLEVREPSLFSVVVPSRFCSSNPNQMRSWGSQCFTFSSKSLQFPRITAPFPRVWNAHLHVLNEHVTSWVFQGVQTQPFKELVRTTSLG